MSIYRIACIYVSRGTFIPTNLLSHACCRKAAIPRKYTPSKYTCYTLYYPPDAPAVDCGAPPTISDGSTTLAGTTFGETTTYTCTTSGFSISGSATITCQANGSWEPEPACTMDRELLSECVRLVQLLCSVQPLIVGHLPLSLMALLEHPHLTQCSMEW